MPTVKGVFTLLLSSLSLLNGKAPATVSTYVFRIDGLDSEFGGIFVSWFSPIVCCLAALVLPSQQPCVCALSSNQTASPINTKVLACVSFTLTFFEGPWLIVWFSHARPYHIVVPLLFFTRINAKETCSVYVYSKTGHEIWNSVVKKPHRSLFLRVILGRSVWKNPYGTLPFSFVENLGGISAKYHELGCEYIGM